MIGVTAREIIDQALILDEGDFVAIKCDSFEEMENLRKNLYKTRKTLLKVHKTLAYMLYISREIKDDGHYVFVTKEKTVSNVAIIGRDGTVRPFERIEPSVISDETEVDRIARLMREDGKTEEEISDTLAEMGEESFDAAAAKIEAAQGAGETIEATEVVTGKRNVRKKKKAASK